MVFFIVALVFLIVHFVMIIWFYITLSITENDFKKERKIKFDPNYNPKVSLFATARNEENGISGFIESLIAQNYENYEIILMDNDSSDKTGEIMDEYQKKHPNLIRVNHHGPRPPSKESPKVLALGELANQAKGDILISLDADEILKPNFVRYVINMMKLKKADMLSGYGYYPMKNAGDKICWPIAIIALTHLILSTRYHKISSTMCISIGTCLAMTKSSYLKTGGFQNPFVKRSLTDDIALARLYKKQGFNYHLTDLKDHMIVHLFDNLKEAFLALTRDIYYGFGGNLLFLFPYTLFIIFLISPFIFFILSLCLGFMHVGIYYLAIGFFIECILISIHHHIAYKCRSIRHNFFMQLHPAMLVFVLIVCFYIHYRVIFKGNFVWKSQVMQLRNRRKK